MPEAALTFSADPTDSARRADRQRVRILIIGGGLSGLHAAATLEASGVHDYVLLEARAEFGGRIHALPAPAGGRFDLGATWYWPEMQPELSALIRGLGLSPFPQSEDGDMRVERSPQGAVRVPGYPASPTGMRLQGGMGALIDALSRQVPPERRRTGWQVLRLLRQGDGVVVEAKDRDGAQQAWHAEQVLLALPPRLAATAIAFDPPLPGPLLQAWRATSTWMAPHAKYLAVYERPFWREAGLSGEGRSSLGPLVEIHDASAPGGPAALFGFLGVPARVRAGMARTALRALCRAQFVRLFGEEASAPRGEWLKDWAADPLTATPLDAQGDSAGHGAPPPTGASDGPWQARLVGVASEWSPMFPGYVAGAIDAAARGVDELLRVRPR